MLYGDDETSGNKKKRMADTEEKKKDGFFKRNLKRFFAFQLLSQASTNIGGRIQKEVNPDGGGGGMELPLLGGKDTKGKSKGKKRPKQRKIRVRGGKK